MSTTTTSPPCAVRCRRREIGDAALQRLELPCRRPGPVPDDPPRHFEALPDRPVRAVEQIGNSAGEAPVLVCVRRSSSSLLRLLGRLHAQPIGVASRPLEVCEFHRLGEHRVSADLGDGAPSRNLPPAEARDLHTLGEIVRHVLDRVIDIVRGNVDRRRTRSPSSCSTSASMASHSARNRLASPIRGRRQHDPLPPKRTSGSARGLSPPRSSRSCSARALGPGPSPRRPWQVPGAPAPSRLHGSLRPARPASSKARPCSDAGRRNRAGSAATSTNHEDMLATTCAVYIVLLAAHARGSRRIGARRVSFGFARGAVGDRDRRRRRVVALIHLGPPVDEPVSKGRRPPADYVEFLG